MLTLPQLLIMAKAPVPGKCKTRLCPPCTYEQAANLAEMALRDTVDIVSATPASQRVLVFDGPGPEWLPKDYRVVPQRGSGLDERLAAAFEDAGGPSLLIGMDTPHLVPPLLRESTTLLAEGVADAVLGPSVDGGYWAIGLRVPDRRAFLGVPMSEPATGAAQLHRLHELGLRTKLLPAVRDVDLFGDALAAAKSAPDSRFAAALKTLGAGEWRASA